MDRLFVPLNTTAFDWFKHYDKTYELRFYGRQYTEKHVFRGRRVELRKGYVGESIWGEIGDVIVGTLEDILDNVSYHKIIPIANNRDDAIKKINEILGIKEKYIAFEVKFKKGNE